jgi:hypothetical protein
MLGRFKQELEILDSTIKAKKKEIAEGDLELTQKSNEIEKLGKEKKTVSENLKILEKNYPWISEKKQ